ncbi:MAG: GtrA family protein [Bacteroidota bacterium]
MSDLPSFKDSFPLLDIDQYRIQSGPRTLVSFLRAQLAALLATAADFMVLIFLTEVMNIWYVSSNFIGAFVGTIISFTLGRYWVFVSKDKQIGHQAARYMLVAFGSMVLNTLGVYLITEYATISYVISKVLVAVIVGIAYNFILHKHFVFSR